MRPAGITILAVLAAIGGLYGLVGALALAGISTISGGLGGPVFASGLVALGYAALGLVVAYGFWDLRPWAWPLGVALAVIGVLEALLRYTTGRASGFELALVIGIAVIIGRYLFTPDVREAFGRRI